MPPHRNEAGSPLNLIGGTREESVKNLLTLVKKCVTYASLTTRRNALLERSLTN